MVLEEDILYRVVFPIVTTCLGGLIIYMARKYNTVIAMVEKQNRTLYGDEGSEWIGISKLTKQLMKSEGDDRRAVIALVAILTRHGIIDTDKELDLALAKIRD